MSQPATLFDAIERLESAAEQLHTLRINARSIYEAIDTKIDVERAIRRVVRDLKRLDEPAVPTAI